MSQGRRRVFKSGPAEEAGECRRHEREEHESPFFRGFWGASPEKIFGLLALLCAFLTVFLCIWDPDFSRFGHKDIPCRVRDQMLDEIVFRQSHVVVFYFFFFNMFL